MFDNQLTKTENIGKNAPGPQYKYDDKIKYGEVSKDKTMNYKKIDETVIYSRTY